MAGKNRTTRRSGYEKASSRDVALRFDTIENLLRADVVVALHDIELSEAELRSANENNIAVRVAGLLCRKDLASVLIEGATVKLDHAIEVEERIQVVIEALHSARKAVFAAEDAGARSALLVGVEGFWPGEQAYDLPHLDRLQTIAVAIQSRSSAYKASERSRERTVKDGEVVIENLERERDGAVHARERSACDGAFGEFIERDRMLLGIPGLPPGPTRSPRWPVLMPRFSGTEEVDERERHRMGAAGFVRMLEAAYPDNKAAPADNWPPNELALRTLVVSHPHGLKLARNAAQGDDPTDRWRSPEVRWNPEVGAPSVSAESASAFSEAYPTRLPLIATERGRAALATLSFMPLPRSAANSNMQSYFTTATWDVVSGNMVALRNNHCCICGAASGNMNRNGWFGTRRDNTGKPVPAVSRLIDVHEAWEFTVREDGIGVQKLTSLLPVCSDCHMVFHVDQVMRDASAFASRAGVHASACRTTALDYVIDRRAAMLQGVVDTPHATAGFLVKSEAELATKLSGQVTEDKWILDLSGMRLLNLSGGDPVLRAGADPALVAGLAVVDQHGTHLDPVCVDIRAKQMLERLANPQLQIAPNQATWTEEITSNI